jgi:putative RecB family exonuclease
VSVDEVSVLPEEPSVPVSPTPRHPGLSPSRASDYLQCPLLFRLRVIDRVPEPASPAAARGTLVHAVLEHLFDLPAGERDLAAATALLAPRWRALLEEDERLQALPESADEEAWLASATDLLATYFTLEDPNRLAPAERELSVRWLTEDGWELRGIVDRLDVAPDGALRVVDYKTGRSPREGYEGSALFQMRFYALLLSRLRGRVPAMLQLVYLGDGVLLRHTPDERELESTERRVRAIWASIQDSARRGDFAPKRSALCGWCAHQALCPLFEGSTPPLDPDAVEHALGVRPDAA